MVSDAKPTWAVAVLELILKPCAEWNQYVSVYLKAF